MREDDVFQCSSFPDFQVLSDLLDKIVILSHCDQHPCLGFTQLVDQLFRLIGREGKNSHGPCFQDAKERNHELRYVWK